MHVISRKALVKFGRCYVDAAIPLDTWYRIVKAATYADAAAVKAQFGSASFLSRNRVVFNIGGKQVPARRRIRVSDDRVRSARAHTCRVRRPLERRPALSTANDH